MADETYTYKLTMGYGTPYTGCDGKDTIDLKDYGMSDQEWDELDENEQGEALDEWALENFWSQGFDTWGEVTK